MKITFLGITALGYPLVFATTKIVRMLENMAMKNHLKLETFAHQKYLEIMSNRVNQYEHADLALLELKEYKLDCVIIDHTFGNVDYSFSHLNTKFFIKQLSKIKKLNIINETFKIYGTNISHDGMPYHELA